MNALEASGLQTLREMGLVCFGDLGDVQLSKIAPDAAVSSGESLEFDYFVLYGDKCLVGEMSGLADESDIKKKYERFRRHFNMLASSRSTRVFDHFNIPPEDRHLFDEVRHFRAFFIADKHERFDLELKEVSGISVIYSGDWETLVLYTKWLGRYAQYPFLKLVTMATDIDMGKDLRFNASKHKLMRIPNRIVARGVETRVDVLPSWRPHLIY